MKRSPHILASAITTLVLAGSSLAAAAPLDIGSRLELFADYFPIERLDGTQLKLQEPRLAGLTLKLDVLWEGAFVGCPAIFKDADLYSIRFKSKP